jgi:hypothetical protein
MAGPHVWMAGDLDHPALAPAAAWLQGVADVAIVPGAHVSPSDRDPAAIVFLQARPGSLAQSDIEQFHHRAPQARLIAIVGPWCAGEPRSGRPCEGVTRIYWHQWAARLPLELGLAGPAHTTGYRSRTLTETDVLLRSLTPTLHRPSPTGLVAIAAISRESFSSLADACWAVGLRSAWQQPHTPPQYAGADLLLIDGWECCPPELGKGNAAHRPTSPAVLLLDWPQPNDLSLACERGIARCIARPLLLTDLFATFDALLAHAVRSGRSRVAA